LNISKDFVFSLIKFCFFEKGFFFNKDFDIAINNIINVEVAKVIEYLSL